MCFTVKLCLSDIIYNSALPGQIFCITVYLQTDTLERDAAGMPPWGGNCGSVGYVICNCIRIAMQRTKALEFLPTGKLCGQGK